MKFKKFITTIIVSSLSFTMLALNAGAAESIANANMEDGGYEIDVLTELGDAVKDVYGIEINITPTGEVLADDINGNLAVCAPSTNGWDERLWSKTTSNVQYDGSSIRWEKGQPVFAETDYAESGYCKFLLHSYWGTFNVNSYTYLDQDGNAVGNTFSAGEEVIDETPAEDDVETEAADEDVSADEETEESDDFGFTEAEDVAAVSESAPVAGTDDSTEEGEKSQNPVTGVTDIAVISVLAVVSLGGVLVFKKKK